MEEQFATYEIALKLKELGFDEDCSAVFYQGKFMNGHIEPHVWYLVNSISTNSDCNSLDIVTAPLWQQVIDWFREKYNIHIYIDFYDGLYGFAIKLNKEKLYNRCGSFEPGFKNYPEAREQAILKAIELIKKQNGTN